MTLPPILLVGGGRMGSALLAGWREQGLTSAIVIDPSPAAQKLAAPGIQIFPTTAEIPENFTPEAVILAVKPQMAAAALPAYARFANHAVFISIMAGKTLHAIATALGCKTAIIRAMPNTPAAVRQGFTVAVANSHASESDQALATKLLEAAGQIAWVTDESLLDPVTAISGGGPAYVFLLTELMEQAAIAQGIPTPARPRHGSPNHHRLGCPARGSDEDAAALRIAVTSPAGTTERALASCKPTPLYPNFSTTPSKPPPSVPRELSD